MSSGESRVHALPAADGGTSEDQLALAHVCTDIDLATIASKLENWEPISSHLSITNAEAVEIKKNHQGDYRLQKTRLLQLWKTKVGKTATYKCLVEVVQATIGDSFAEDIYDMAVETYRAMKSPQGRESYHHVNPTMNDLMNLPPLIGSKWGLVGTKLGICEDTLTQISVTGDDIRCSAKMLRIWHNTEKFPTWVDLLRVLELPYVGLLDVAEKLKAHMFSCTLLRNGRRTNGLSVKVPTESSKKYICFMVDLVELLPPDSWRKMKTALEHYEDPISSLYPEEMDTAVYENVRSVSDMLKSLKKHGLLSAVELGWLKFLVDDVVKCPEASKRIKQYEAAIESDSLLGKVHFANNQHLTDDTAMLYCRTRIQPETATCQNVKLAKAGCTSYVGVQEHEAVLHSVQVGSIIFFWKIPFRRAVEMKLSKSVSLETKRMFDDANILDISVMVGDSYESVSVEDMSVAAEMSVQTRRKLSLQSPTAAVKLKRKLSDSRKFWLVLRRKADTLVYQLEFYINRQTAIRGRDATKVILISEITDVQLSKNQKYSIEVMCGAMGYSLGLNCEGGAEKLMSDLQYLVTEYNKLYHHVLTQSRCSSIGKLLEVDVTLTSEVNNSCLSVQLDHRELNVINYNISVQGADKIVTVIPQALSLEKFVISNSKASLADLFKMIISVNVSSLQVLRIRNSAVGDNHVNDIVAIIHNNFLLEDVNLGGNELSSIGIASIVNELSFRNRILKLDISNNRLSDGNVKIMATALHNCATLQELNLSSNLLMFSDMIRVVQAFQGHPNLRILNMENKTVLFISECEFLIDVILSINQPLQYLNVCSRDIRPRFKNGYLLLHEKCDRFVIQNLYLSYYLLLDSISESISESSPTYPIVTSTQNTVIKVTESCPLNTEDIFSYYVDHNGNTFYNKPHNFAFVIPPGAVSQGDCIEIQATASRFGPFHLPDGCYPISSYFWITANYTFKVPVFLILSHHASFRDVDDVNKVFAMEVCSQNSNKTTEGKLVMNKLLDGVYFDYKIGFCLISTNHFCSYCLGKDDINVPNKFYISYYTYNFKGYLKAEICICHVNKECIKEVQRQYCSKEAELMEAPVIFSLNHQQDLMITVHPERVPGWNVTVLTDKVCYDDFDFRQYDKLTLQTLEETFTFPPRFVVNYKRTDPNAQLGSTIIVSNEDHKVKLQLDYVSDPVQGKPVSSTKLRFTIHPFGGDVVGHFSNICQIKPKPAMLSKFKIALCQDWFYIGLSLGIPPENLNEINKDQIRSRDKCYHMLEEWLRLDISACYCKLISAVVAERNFTLAEDIKQHILLYSTV